MTVLFSCSNNDNPFAPPTDGGPCKYETISFEANVSGITPYASDDYSIHGITQNDIVPLFHVELSFNKSSLSVEPQYLEELVHVRIDSTFLTENNISFGTKFTGTIEEIKEGSCNPLMIVFDQKFVDNEL